MTIEFFKKYEFKIKSRDELLRLIGDFPRKKKIILCHGVFDVVHPGHVRHLAYAKSKASILVASITSDVHITKGKYRPHVPEQLRALNLAALDMVDYVIIDKNKMPLALLESLKPEYFAKGFEYMKGGLPPATQEEADIVESYGGEMIFTPGDIVYSSSQLINLSPPEIRYEKLLSLMHERSIKFDDLRNTLKKFRNFHVHVVGDTIVDSYTYTNLIGGQTKTPTFSVLFQNQENYIGGAGIVAQHLRFAGAGVAFSSVVGDDQLGEFVQSGLKEAGIECKIIVDETRPTVNKNVIIAQDYRLLKIDTLDNRTISEAILDKIVEGLSNTKSNAVVFSDFRHGIFNQMTIPELTNAIPKAIFRVADSQVASRWGNITEFKDFDLIAPNEREARFALADQDSTVGSLAGNLIRETQSGTLFLKLGERGIFVLSAKVAESDKADHFSIDSFCENVVDAVGAGDALLAYSTLAMLATGDDLISAILGSMAAACECEIDGNIPIKPSDVEARISRVETLTGYVN